jgi:hypothetical protein
VAGGGIGFLFKYISLYIRGCECVGVGVRASRMRVCASGVCVGTGIEGTWVIAHRVCESVCIGGVCVSGVGDWASRSGINTCVYVSVGIEFFLICDLSDFNTPCWSMQGFGWLISLEFKLGGFTGICG